MAVTTVDAATLATKWATNLGAAQSKIQAGVEAVTVSPGVAAARNQQGYIAGVQANVGKWARNVQSVTLQDWQTAVINKGLIRVGPGAQAAEPKFATVLGKILVYERQLIGQLPQRGDTAANINRAVAWMQGMAKGRGSFTA